MGVFTLTYSSLANHPCKTKEKHYSPDVKKTSHQYSFNPPKLDYLMKENEEEVIVFSIGQGILFYTTMVLSKHDI